MTAELVDAVVAAWAAWEAAVATRSRVLDLDAALEPIAQRRGATVSQVRAAITAAVRDGCSVRQAVAALTVPSLFDDDGRPWSVPVPVGEWL